MPQPPSPPAVVAWPPGARAVVTDLDGPVRHLHLGGPPGAPVLVCVHGLGGTALTFGLLAPRLTDTHRVLALDLYGHGGSGLSTRGHGLAADRRLLARFLREVVGEPAVLVGHSMGGVIALLHAADAPETLRALVLLSPPVPGPSGAVDVPLAMRRALLATPGVAAAVRRRLSRMTAEEVVAQQLRQATPHADRVPADAVAPVVAETRVRQARRDAAAASAEQWTGILDTMAVLARPRRLRRTIASIAVPGLWLQGADDPLARAGHARALAAVRPDWPFELRPGVGHLLAVEDPDWTAGTIRRWLAGTGVSDRPVPPRPP